MDYKKIYESTHELHTLWDEVCQIAPYCRNQADVETRIEKLKNMDTLRAIRFFPLMYDAFRKNDADTINSIYEMFDWVIAENKR